MYNACKIKTKVSDFLENDPSELRRKIGRDLVELGNQLNVQIEMVSELYKAPLQPQCIILYIRNATAVIQMKAEEGYLSSFNAFALAYFKQLLKLFQRADTVVEELESCGYDNWEHTAELDRRAGPTPPPLKTMYLTSQFHVTPHFDGEKLIFHTIYDLSVVVK